LRPEKPTGLDTGGFFYLLFAGHFRMNDRLMGKPGPIIPGGPDLNIIAYQ